MIKFKIHILACLLFWAGALVCQDIHLTQFYSNPVYLNPAFTGAGICSRLAGTYRNQWPAISNGYVSYIFAADHFISKSNSGIGIIFSNDVAGSGSLRTTSAMASYAYEARLSRKLVFRAGLQAGAGFKSINMNKLLFGDQIARGGNVTTIENAPQTAKYFDSNAGVLLYSKDFWIGVSAFHLNRPNEALLATTNSTLPVKMSVHGGVKILINKAHKGDESGKAYITPAFHYRHQEKFDQLDLGFYFTKSVINIGLWYRGIPMLKAYKAGYSNNDALSFLIGFTTDKFNIGYSYDYTISRLSGNTAGAHEVCLSYQFCAPKKKKYRLIVPCPRF
jgi:type IX secretion system PorP/SprF family membrane protein